MTRAEKQQVRDALDAELSFYARMNLVCQQPQMPTCYCAECRKRNSTAALALLDAELKEPEPLDWRALAECETGSYQINVCACLNREDAEEDAEAWRSDPKNQGSPYVAVVQSRVQAGRWESEAILAAGREQA